MSFRLKLIVLISLLVSVTFGVGGSLLISTSFQSVLVQEKNTAMNSYENVRNTLMLINSYDESADNENMSDALKKIKQQRISDWQVISLEGEQKLIYEDGDVNLLSVKLPVPEDDRCVYILSEDKYGQNIQIKSVLYAGAEKLTLSARYDLSTAYEARDTQQRLFFVIYISVVLLGILISVVMSFALTKRLKKLTNAVRQISDGDLSVRSKIRSKDEFGQLSENFDDMADRLQGNIYSLEDDMRRQESFMGAFAHELKTPMTSIIGYADLLRQGGLSEQDTISSANYIFSEGKRLEKLSFKLLDLLMMEKDEPEMKKVKLSSLLSYINRILAPAMKKKKVKLICRCEKIEVYLEPDLIKSLLYNLVDNASKAVAEGGFVVITGKATENGCEIQVVDNGRGMEEEELSRITEAFYRVDKSRSRKQGGAGLGLALCRKIVELHDGTIKFASIPGKGTSVVVELHGKEKKDA